MTTYQPHPTAPSTPGALDRVFAGLRRSPIVRADDRRLGGVCAGLAAHLGVAPKIVRIVAVITAFLGFGVTLYLLGWLLLPDTQGRTHLERALRAGHGGSITLLIVAALAVLPDATYHDHGWLGLIVAGIVLAIVVGRAARGGDASSQGPVPAYQPPSAAPTGASSDPGAAGYPSYPGYPTYPTYPSSPQDSPRG